METATEVSSAKAVKPVKVLKDGGLSVSIFPNTTTVRDREMTFFNSQLQRTYKDGTFKTTHSLGKDDLLRASQLLIQAHEWIVDQQQTAKKKESK